MHLIFAEPPLIKYYMQSFKQLWYDNWLSEQHSEYKMHVTNVYWHKLYSWNTFLNRSATQFHSYNDINKNVNTSLSTDPLYTHFFSCNWQMQTVWSVSFPLQLTDTRNKHPIASFSRIQGLTCVIWHDREMAVSSPAITACHPNIHHKFISQSY